MIFLYNLAIRTYWLFIALSSLFSTKAKKWISGRKNHFNNLAEYKDTLNNPVWFHAASLGEFEQGRPLIEALKRQYPEIHIVITFFSPSGYEIRKNYPLADLVTYLPLDTKANATKFISIVKPRLAIFIKYEIWYHFFQTLIRNSIPLYIVSSKFRQGQFYFQSYGKAFKTMLQNLDQIFVQDASSYNLLKSHGFQNITQAGDTRVDRVISVVNEKSNLNLLKALPEVEIVAGSTWPEDEKHLLPVICSPNIRAIIAPHEVSKSRVDALEKFIAIKKRTARLSEITQGKSEITAEVIIVDSIGLLSVLYGKGKIAYVGGGFGSGIHNILEPAAHLKPVIFGPTHKKFQEAIDFKNLKVGFAIDNKDDLTSVLDKLRSDSVRSEIAGKLEIYFRERAGATQKIMSYLENSGNLIT